MAEDERIVFVLCVLVQCTMVTAGALLVARALPHRPAARASVLTLAVVALLASPLVTAGMRYRGVTLIALPLARATGNASAEPESAAVAETDGRAGPPKAIDASETTMSNVLDAVEIPPLPARFTPTPPATAVAEVPRAAMSNVREIPPPDEPEGVSLRRAIRRALATGLAVWLLGGLVRGVGVARSWCNLRGVLRTAQPIEDPALDAAWSRVRRTLQFHAPPRIVSSSRMGCPAVTGVFRPVIVLPSGLARKLGPAELETVLLHEAAHVVRRDQLVLHVQQILAVLFWPHPMVHLLNRALTQAREEVCDNYVLGTVDRARYAQTLLRLATLAQETRLPVAVTGLLRSGWKLEQRISTLLDDRRNTMVRMNVWGVAVSLAVTALLLVAGGGTVVTAEPEAAQSTGVESTGVESTGVQPTVASSSDVPSSAEETTRAEREPSAGASRREAPPAETEKSRTQRVRELIYVLRQHRVFSRNEEWSTVIRELVQIGEPAVPELVAELNRTDRDQTLRALGFTLRAIGDPRAVPGLIRAIPKTLRGRGSDCAFFLSDPDLLAFMLEHDRSESQKSRVSYGRPVNEILSALEEITGHSEPSEGRDKLRHVFLGGTPEEQAAKRGLFQERMEHWQWWWSAHRQELVTEEQLASVRPASSEEDLVAEAGLARFGPLFPTGSHVRLGPVNEVRLDRSQIWNAESHIDFDTGRTYEKLEGIDRPAADKPGESSAWMNGWYRKMGIDARLSGSMEEVDLHSWLVDNGRWDTFEEELLSGRPIELGRETTHLLIPFQAHRSDFQRDRLGTFLFTTREGGRGIVQVFPKAEGSHARRLRYRMIGTDDAEQADRPAAVARRESSTPLGKTITTTLQAAANGSGFLLDLPSGREHTLSDEFASTGHSPARLFYSNEAFATWCREHGVDLAAGVATIEMEASLGSTAPSPPQQPSWNWSVWTRSR